MKFLAQLPAASELLGNGGALPVALAREMEAEARVYHGPDLGLRD